MPDRNGKPLREDFSEALARADGRPRREDFMAGPTAQAPSEITEQGMEYAGNPQAADLLQRLRGGGSVSEEERKGFIARGGTPEAAGFQAKRRFKGPGEEFYEPVAKSSLRALGGLAALPLGPGAMIASGAGAGALVGAADEAAQGVQGVREPGAPTSYLKQAGIGALEGGTEMAGGLGMGAARNLALKKLAGYGASKGVQFAGGLAAESLAGSVPGLLRGEGPVEALKSGVLTAATGRAIEAPVVQAAHGIKQLAGKAPIMVGARVGPNIPEEPTPGKPREFKTEGVTKQKIFLKTQRAADRLPPPRESFQEATPPKIGDLGDYTPEQQVALAEAGLAPLKKWTPEQTIKPKQNAAHTTDVESFYKKAGEPEAVAANRAALERGLAPAEAPRSVGEEMRAMRGEDLPRGGSVSKEGKYQPEVSGGVDEPLTPQELAQDARIQKAREEFEADTRPPIEASYVGVEKPQAPASASELQAEAARLRKLAMQYEQEGNPAKGQVEAAAIEAESKLAQAKPEFKYATVQEALAKKRLKTPTAAELQAQAAEQAGEMRGYTKRGRDLMESLERGRAERAPQGRNAEEQAKLDALKRLASGGASTGPPKPPVAEAAGPAPGEPQKPQTPKREPQYPNQPGEAAFTKGHRGALRGARARREEIRKNPPPGYEIHEYNHPDEIRKHIDSFGEAIFKVKTMKNATAENPSGTDRAIRFTRKPPEGFKGFKQPGSKANENKVHNLDRAFEVNENNDYMRDPTGPDGYAYKSMHLDEAVLIDGPNDARAYVPSEVRLREMERMGGTKPLMVGTGGTPQPAPGGFKPQRLPEQKRPLLPSKLIEGAGGGPAKAPAQTPIQPWEDQPLRGGRRLLDIIGKAAGAPYRLEQRGMGKLEEISGLARKLEGVEGGAGLGRAFRVGGPLAMPGYRAIGLSARGGALVGAGARKLARFKAPGPERRGYKPPIKARDSMPAIRAVLLRKKRKEKE